MIPTSATSRTFLWTEAFNLRLGATSHQCEAHVPPHHAVAFPLVVQPLHGNRCADYARHTAATVLLILGVPDVVIDSVTGWEPGGAARMRARYMHVMGAMLRKVAQQVGDALWELPKTN